MKEEDIKAIIGIVVFIILLAFLIAVLLSGIYLIISAVNLETPLTPDWKSFNENSSSINPSWIQYHHQFNLRMGFGSAMVGISSFILIIFTIATIFALADELK